MMNIAPNVSLVILHVLLLTAACLPAAWSLPEPPDLAHLVNRQGRVMESVVLVYTVFFVCD